MRKKMDRKKIKRAVGFFLMIGLLVFNVWLWNDNAQLGTFLFVGWVLGYILTRSRIGFATIYVEFFNTGAGTRFYYLLLLFVFGALGTAVIHSIAADGAVLQFQASGSQTAIPGTSAVSPVDLSLIIGSLLFGSGMVINKGGGSETLRKTGQGNGRYMLTFLFLLIGTLPGQVAKTAFDQSSLSQYSIRMYLPDQAGYTGALLLTAVLAGAVFLLTRSYEKKRMQENAYETKEKQEKEKHPIKTFSEARQGGMYHTLFQANWPALLGVVGVSAVLFVSLIFTGETLKVTKPLLKAAVALFSQFGVSFDHPAFSQTLKTLQNGIWNDTESVRNAGVLGGALLYSLTSNSFDLSWNMKWREAPWYMSSGLLMGFGAILAGGGNIGALYSGIVNLSLSGWVVLFFGALGAIATMTALNGRVSTIHKANE